MITAQSKSLAEGRHGWHSMFGRLLSEIGEQAHWIMWRILQLPIRMRHIPGRPNAAD